MQENRSRKFSTPRQSYASRYEPRAARIFVALASYREPELRLTIEDCIGKARHPGRLRFGICHQYDDAGKPDVRQDCISDLEADERLRIVKYDYRTSKGGCWARALVQELYWGEHYTIQVDAHSRFTDEWDVKLIEMMDDLPGDRPLITGFPPLYFREDGQDIYTDLDDRSRVPTTVVKEWSPDGWVHHPTEYLPQNTAIPRRTRVLSGAFVFTLGRWIRDVPQDPEHQYAGEEFALTLRSFTHGYDLFNPLEIVVWHRGHPEPNPKYITDFPKQLVQEHHQRAMGRLRNLFRGDPESVLGAYSLGQARTLDDYYEFSGLDCRTQTIHPHAYDGVPPDPVTIRTDARLGARSERAQHSAHRSAATLDREQTGIYTVVCTDTNDYGHWQCELLEHTWKQVDQPGQLIRLVAANDSETLPEHQHAHVMRTSSRDVRFITGDDYMPFNRLFSLQEWLEVERPFGTVLILDCDMVFRRRIETQVKPGAPRAQHWIGFGLGGEIGKACRSLSRVDLASCQPVTWPALIHTEDLRRILPRWIELTSLIRAESGGWESDMFAFVVASAELGVSYEIGTLAAWMNWPEELVENAPIVHYCQPVTAKDGSILWYKQSYRAWDDVDFNPQDAELSYCRDFLKILQDFVRIRRPNRSLKSGSAVQLHELGKKHQTDKHDENHSFNSESYLHIYERYFEPLKSQSINFLELGVKRGSSLRMWKEFFPNAHIYGVDSNPDSKRHEEEQIEILISSQDDSTQLTALAERVGGFDVILDDASHINHLTTATFQILFPWLRSGGFYIMEDLGMSWVDLAKYVDEPGFMDGELKKNQQQGVDVNHTREDLDNLFRSILFEMDMIRGPIRYLHFWSNIAVLNKA